MAGSIVAMNYDTPYPICRAVSRIFFSGEFSSMRPRTMQLFALLLRYVQVKNPLAPIHTWRKDFHELLACSHDTAERALEDLINQGYVVRLQQDRYIRSGRFGTRTICLSQKAVVLLGLDCTNSARSANLRDRHINNPLPGVKHNRQSLRADLTNATQEPTMRSVVRFGNHTVPKCLAWLVQEAALQLPALFKLMKLCRNKGFQLSDVLANCEAKIRQQNISGQSLYCYLLACIGKPVDWSYVAKADKKAKDVKASIQRAKQELQSLTGTVVSIPGVGRVSIYSCGNTIFGRALDSNRTIVERDLLHFVSKGEKAPFDGPCPVVPRQNRTKKPNLRNVLAEALGKRELVTR